MNIIKESYVNGYIVEISVIFCLSAILCGFMIISSKNPIVAVLCLIGLFGSIAIILIIMDLSLMGYFYIIISAGAVSILFLFVVLMLDIRLSELQIANWNSLILGIITCLTFGYLFLSQNFPRNTGQFNNGWWINLEHIVSLVSTPRPEAGGRRGEINSFSWDGNLLNISHIENLGVILYSSNYLIWILLIGLIILLGMVGSLSLLSIEKSEKNNTNLYKNNLGKSCIIAAASKRFYTTSVGSGCRTSKDL